ncbi:MAG TPA: exonuclease domain-containing protein [Planctomycetota bacterium]|nr:exonuclease domain-containing protein [Planctomycetota bacterium]
MDTALVCLDTETATLSGPPHLLELGAVRVIEGEAVEHFSELVLPAVAIDPEATRIHGIEERDVRAARPAAEVLERFTAWLGDDWMAAHNASFDARVLAFEYARAGLAAPGQPLIDTLRLARRALPKSPDHKLETLAEHLGLEEHEHHRALPDAVWCWKVLEACIERLGGECSPAALLARSGGVPITFAGAAPRPGRALKPRLRELERACVERRRVRLLYAPVQQTPVPLEVVPWLLFDQAQRGYLEAECCASGTLKTYRLDRIQRLLA